MDEATRVGEDPKPRRSSKTEKTKARGAKAKQPQTLTSCRYVATLLIITLQEHDKNTRAKPYFVFNLEWAAVAVMFVHDWVEPQLMPVVPITR